jgi:hypothetical protein
MASIRITIEHQVPGDGHADDHIRTLAWDADVFDMVEAIAGLLMSMGYSQSIVIQAMAGYAEERGEL